MASEEDIVRRLGANQATFREVMRIYDLNPGLAENAYFFAWLAENYRARRANGDADNCPRRRPRSDRTAESG